VDADDRLVRLHAHPCELRDQAAGAVDLGAIDSRAEVEIVRAGLDRHDDFFERGVPRALADAVHAGLYLPRARGDGRQAVGDGEAEVVVAVHGDARFVDVRHVLLNLADEVAELVGNRVADRIRNVDGRRAGDRQSTRLNSVTS